MCGSTGSDLDEIVNVLKYYSIDRIERAFTSKARIYLHYCPKCRIVLAITARPVTKPLRNSEDENANDGRAVLRICPICGSRLIYNYMVTIGRKPIEKTIEALSEIRDQLVDIHRRLTETCESYCGELSEIISKIRSIVKLLKSSEKVLE